MASVRDSTTSSSTLRRRLRPRFGLRSLLAAMLLFCLALAAWAAYARPYYRQHALIATLRAHDATVETEPVDSPWLRWLIGPECACHVTKVDVYQELPEEEFRELCKLPRLKELHLAGAFDATQLQNLRAVETLHVPGLTDDGLRYISELKSLKHLRLGVLYRHVWQYIYPEERNPVTDAGLVHVAKIGTLETLALHGPGFTDEGIKHLASMRQLKSIDFYYTMVTKAGADQLRDALPLCRVGRFYSFTRVPAEAE